MKRRVSLTLVCQLMLVLQVITWPTDNLCGEKKLASLENALAVNCKLHHYLDLAHVQAAMSIRASTLITFSWIFELVSFPFIKFALSVRYPSHCSFELLGHLLKATFVLAMDAASSLSGGECFWFATHAAHWGETSKRLRVRWWKRHCVNGKFVWVLAGSLMTE